MEKRDILLQIIQHYTNGNKAQFAKMIGVIPQNVSSWIKRNSFDADIISAKCRDINPAFILTGEGPITLDAGVSTPTASPVASPQPLNNANLDLRINELLTISTNLYKMFESVNNRLAESTAIVSKSQAQFDNVLRLYEETIKLNKNNNSDRTTYGIVAEDIKR
ncbi:MAG: hypothetical protein KBT39_06805 [Bacteroidales bacterium]|nr:hypothetical protein [Bacteroidales bacterium]